ncbi:MAG: hypothetical protein BAJALOKI1v1_860021 [Promethearchaeota archaeon]|nr:MAG: hypothetical protein BAJALOKI1v1_860021 [Candidatus Lokiarchaeota archaeon]
MGCNAFRMGIAWSRIQPTTFLEPYPPPKWDSDAVAHYAKILETLITYKMEPILTLHHFTHPMWLDIDLWLSKKGPQLFIEFATRIVDELNQKLLKRVNRTLTYFIVFNEPNLFPILLYLIGSHPHQKKGPRSLLKTYDAIFSIYVKIFDQLHDLYKNHLWKKPSISYNLFSTCIHELDKMSFDLMRLHSNKIDESQIETNIKAYKRKWYHRVERAAKQRHTKREYENYLKLVSTTAQLLPPFSLKKTIQAIYDSPQDKKVEYLAMDIYDPFTSIEASPP